jgi:hypothetical protein
VEPIRSALQKTEQQVEALERERRDAFSSLRTQMESTDARAIGPAAARPAIW